ncbi:MAG: hypothetical protein F4Z67_04925 [Synechococcus sp. SB0667_bin_8]|uniref:Uncharacterized protein n=1 Tax=Synechococcus sp. SB0676_bin_10 TaxID=2604869 RepID=A0A6B1F6X9_9SYNE|nr:hypothetical protein [Cyanobacteria bacterium MAG IRC3_bin_20]MXX08964.1 hypothetical protein [Synechococcus sp. SB0667_bin_8]MYG38741.1 hypothetical protein [Synechococcus sp. SB0676_bin_10]MYG64094.1 hypothetical protein [Synechococcus sp. SB0675_bin_7]
MTNAGQEPRHTTIPHSCPDAIIAKRLTEGLQQGYPSITMLGEGAKADGNDFLADGKQLGRGEANPWHQGSQQALVCRSVVIFAIEERLQSRLPRK